MPIHTICIITIATYDMWQKLILPKDPLHPFIAQAYQLQSADNNDNFFFFRVLNILTHT